MTTKHNQPRPVILSVDDSEQALALRAAILQKHGYKVLSSSNTLEARALLENNRVDAIITDHNMPLEDGLSFGRRVREAGYEMPIIVYSGSLDLNEESQDLVNAFVSKGEPIQTLLETLAMNLIDFRNGMHTGRTTPARIA